MFSTLHTNSATQTIDRILDSFPADQQRQIRAQLAQVLKAVVSMKLVETRDGQGRVAALEIMRSSPKIAKMIEQGETSDLHEEVESSVGYYRMQTMNQSLLALLVHNTISYQEAMEQSPDPEDLSLKLRKMFPNIEETGGDMSTSDFAEIQELQQFRKLYEEQEEKTQSCTWRRRTRRCPCLQGMVDDRDREIQRARRPDRRDEAENRTHAGRLRPPARRGATEDRQAHGPYPRAQPAARRRRRRRQEVGDLSLIPELNPEQKRRIAALALIAALVATFAAAAGAETLRVRVDGDVAALTDDNQIVFEAYPRRGEGLNAFTRRLTGTTRNAGVVSRANGRPRRLISGVRYKVPYEILTGERKLGAVRALFPADRALSTAWEHTVRNRANPPSLWRIAEWFTGDGRSFAALRRANGLADDTVRPGQALLIPAALLLAPFRQALPLVDYETDATGEYAVYRLQQGEALYSAVVVRFTGATFADDVNNLAGELATLNGIADVTDIPVGRRIRVPFDLLLPEYLPADHPRRVEYAEGPLGERQVPEHRARLAPRGHHRHPRRRSRRPGSGVVVERLVGERLRLRHHAAGQAAARDHTAAPWWRRPATARSSRSSTATSCRARGATRC